MEVTIDLCDIRRLLGPGADLKPLDMWRVESSAYEWIGLVVVERRSLMKRRKSVGETNFNISETKFNMSETKFNISETKFNISETKFKISETKFNISH